jgi:hypothetical protein
VRELRFTSDELRLRIVILHSSFAILLFIACRPAVDYFPYEKGMRWESRQAKFTIVDQDTTRTEQVITTGYKERIVYSNLGRVVEVDDVVGRDTTRRYYRRTATGVWLLWEGWGEVPDSVHVLPTRPAPGQSWLFSSPGKSVVACTVMTRGTQTVSAGTFRNCLEVRFLFPGMEGAAETRWYAPRVGVVRDEFAREQSVNGHRIREQSVTELLSFRRKSEGGIEN